MSDHGKLDWSQMRPVDPEEAELALEKMATGRVITMRTTAQEIPWRLRSVPALEVSEVVLLPSQASGMGVGSEVVISSGEHTRRHEVVGIDDLVDEQRVRLRLKPIPDDAP